MKKLILFLTFSIYHFSLSTIMAQAPQAVPYQGIARDNAGNPIVNHAVSLRFTIHDVTAGGTIVYWETQIKTTNSFGLFTANIGEGTVLGGVFAAINWGGGSKFMQVEMDASGGVTYTNMGTQQMLSVPYALSAANGNWTKNGNNITNSNVSNVGIGNNTPTYKLDVTGNGRFSSGVSGFNTLPYSAAIYGNSSAPDHDYGIYGVSNTSTGIAIYGYALNGLAGYFSGNVQVDGNFNVNGNMGIGTSAPAAKLEVAGQVKITGGAPGVGKVLTSDATGLASWGPSITHFIGESYGGGIVFYVYDNGQHGLIAATADQSTGMRWWAGTYTNTMAYGGKLNACNGCVPASGGIGGGRRNTDLILASQGVGDGVTYAAKVCIEYSVTTAGVTYEDWSLPSIDELHLLYLQKTTVGGFALDFYWSSTEASSNGGAWMESFVNGLQSNFNKNVILRVRAIRAF